MPDELLVRSVAVSAHVLVVLVVGVGHGVDHLPHVLTHRDQGQLEPRASLAKTKQSVRPKRVPGVEARQARVGVCLEVHPHLTRALTPNESNIISKFSAILFSPPVRSPAVDRQ